VPRCYIDCRHNKSVYIPFADYARTNGSAPAAAA
jgi:hypothetical protein